VKFAIGHGRSPKKSYYASVIHELIAAADFSDFVLSAREHRATRGRWQVWNLGARFRNFEKSLRLVMDACVRKHIIRTFS
jgi:hypothetical protein